ncbi:hypothetical protein [Pseudoduganella violacea]|uniref:ExsA-like N-terminal regulatory domain-containing protein n=1 Tax=Pseudoduganella violacea TaxID=1715466 RepID=A0A7W5FWH9_9BURK|nr:hypothetical protein [Pseudoduganella violacea]MBB3122030.1 hypothetical protein [Pseudoduganella violacea]
MTLKATQAELYAMEGVAPILAGEHSCILRKTLKHNLDNKAIHIGTPLIMYVAQGQQFISDSAGLHYVVDEGQMVFLSPGTYNVSHRVTAHASFDAMLLFIDRQLVEKCLSDVATDNPPPSDDGKRILYAGEQIRRYMDAQEYVYRNACSNDALLELKLLELLHLIALQDPAQQLLRAMLSEDSDSA